jgi:lipopolysaccharide assembly outer membrane protein LptD (OstA)
MNKKKLLLYLFIAGFMAFIFISPAVWKISDLDEGTARSSKRLELEDSRIQGYKEGKSSWEIKAAYIWSGRNKYLFKAETVDSGRLFDSAGIPVVDQLVAETVRVNSRSKTLTAQGNVSFRFLRRVQGEKEKQLSERDYISIKAGTLKYFSHTKKTYLRENVVIQERDVKIYPTKGVEIDHDKNVAYVEEGFRLESDSFVASADQLIIYIDDDYAELQGNVVVQKKALSVLGQALDKRETDLRQSKTLLTCDFLRYETIDGEAVISVSENVKVYQSGKVLSGKSGTYRQARRFFSMTDGVRIELSDLAWMIDRARKKKFENETVSSALKTKTVVDCHSVQFDGEAKRLNLLGNIKIRQPDLFIQCQKIRFDDESGFVSLYGGVKVVRNNQDRFEGDELVLDLINETFKANKGVQTEFNL